MVAYLFLICPKLLSGIITEPCFKDLFLKKCPRIPQKFVLRLKKYFESLQKFLENRKNASDCVHCEDLILRDPGIQMSNSSPVELLTYNAYK